MKNILANVLLLFSLVCFSQISNDFENNTWAIGNNSNSGIQGVYEVVDNPFPTGINLSSKVLKMEQTSESKKWDWVLLSGGGNINDGRFFKFKFLSINETTVEIMFALRIENTHINGASHNCDTAVNPDCDLGTADDRFVIKSLTGLTLNEWNEIEVDCSDIDPNGNFGDGWITRFEIAINKDNNRDGDVYYIDDLSQSSSATLSIEYLNSNKIIVHPNPTDGLLHISDVSDMQRVTILNLLGQNVKTLEAANTIDVSELKEGVYFLSADNGLTHKFIKR